MATGIALCVPPVALCGYLLVCAVQECSVGDLCASALWVSLVVVDVASADFCAGCGAKTMCIFRLSQVSLSHRNAITSPPRDPGHTHLPPRRDRTERSDISLHTYIPCALQYITKRSARPQLAITPLSPLRACVRISGGGAHWCRPFVLCVHRACNNKLWQIYIL